MKECSFGTTLAAVIALAGLCFAPAMAMAGQDIEGRGVVEPAQRFVYRLKPGDVVLEMFVSEGDQVRKGDKLLRLANVDLVSRFVGLRQSKLWYLREIESLAALDQEIAIERRNLDMITRQLAKPEMGEGPAAARLREEERKLSERLRTLAVRKENSGSQKGALTEALRLIDESLDLLDKQLDALMVTAPFDGVARSVEADTNSLAPPMAALEVRDESTLAVQVDLWQHQVPYVKVGNKALIYPDFYGERKFEGLVTRIDPPRASPGLRDFPKFPVTVKIGATETGLLVGMVVSVKILSENPRD